MPGHKYESEEDDESRNKRESSRLSLHNGYASSLIKRPEISSRKNVELLKQRSHVNQAVVDLSNCSIKNEQDTSCQETGTVNNTLLLSTLSVTRYKQK